MLKGKKIVFVFCLLILLSGCEGAAGGSTPKSEPPAVQTPSNSAPAPKAADPAPKKEPEKKSVFPVTFETPLKDHGKDRTKNIKIAAMALNCTVIKDGEEFSFNDEVGKRTKEAGYEMATIFVDGEKVDGLGGGICQISTTLYNAALKAKFKITERHVHALPVPYIEKGKDATVAYGSLDLKFINNSGEDALLTVAITDEVVRVTIEKNKKTKHR